MVVTILTDASYSEEHKIGAWACWIKADDLIIKRGGKIHGNVFDNNLCEVMAIAHALQLLKRQKDLRDCELVIRTDSKASIKMIRGGIRKQIFSTAIDYIVDQVHQAASYRLVHIEAHKWNRNSEKYSKPKYFANRWCDQMARRHLRDAIRKAELEKSLKRRIRSSKKNATRRHGFKGNPKFAKTRKEGYKRTRSKIRLEA